MIVLALTMSFFGFSQNSVDAKAQSPEARKNAEISKRKGDQRYQEIIKALNLTPDQKEKLKEINKFNKDAKAKVNEDNSLSEDDKKERLKEIRKEKTKRFMEILTPEQISLYKELKKSGKDNE